MLIIPGKYWNNAQNRRKFFDDFAAKRGFDALIAENWYPIQQKDIIAVKVRKSPLFLKLIFAKGGAPIMYYHGSLPKALQYLYPEMKLDEKNFGKVARIQTINNGT